MSADSVPTTRSLPIRWSLLIAALLGALVMVWMRSHTPDVAAKSTPYMHVGERGQKVVARNFSA